VLDQLFELKLLFHHHIQDLNHHEYVFDVPETKNKFQNKHFFFKFNYHTVATGGDSCSS